MERSHTVIDNMRIKEIKKSIKKVFFSCLNFFKPTYVVNYINVNPEVKEIHLASLKLEGEDLEYLNYQKLFLSSERPIIENKRVEMNIFNDVIVDLDNGVAITNDRKIITESLKYPGMKSGTYLSKPTRIKQIKGNIIVINPAMNSQYFHVWFDGLIKLFYLSKIDIPCKIVITTKAKSIYKDVINRFAKKYDVEVVEISETQYIKVDSYFTIKNASWAKHAPYFCKDMNLFYCLLFENNNTNHNNPSKFFIKRKVVGRGMINESEVEEYFKSKGFELVCLEELSLQQQFSIFNKAQVVAGLHGAGFTNLIFASPKLKVIELQNFAVVTTYFFISKQLGLEYFPVFYENYNKDYIENPYTNSRAYYKQKLQSVKFSISEIDKVVQDVLHQL